MFNTLLNIALRGIIRNFRQSLTALISIAASFVSLTLFQGYMDDVQKMYQDANIEREMMGHFIIEKKDPTLFLSLEEQSILNSFLNDQKEIAARMRFLPITGTITNGQSSMVFVGRGMDIEEGDKMRSPSWQWNALAGSPLKAGEDGLLIGHKLANILGCHPKELPDFVQGKGGFSPKVRDMNCKRSELQLNIVTLHGQMNAMNLQLTGITDAVYKELDERYVGLSLQTAQTLMDTNQVASYSVKLKDPNQIDSMVQRTNAFLESQNINAKAVRWEQHRLGDLYNRTMDLLTLFRNFVVSVILVISSLSVFNTLLRNISERSREIGTLRSLGLNPGHIYSLFGLEAAILAISGSSIGLILTLSLEFIVNLIGLTYKPGVFSSPVPFSIYVSPTLMGQTAIFLCTLVILTALLSVRRPIKQRITECLGHV